MKNYFAIGIEHTKTAYNIGTLWRSAYSLGASHIFTIGCRYEKQSSDTTKSWRHIPLFHHKTFQDFYATIPYDCQLIGVEITNSAIEIKNFYHPHRAIYLLGAEDHGLTKEALSKCHKIVKLPGKHCLNVAVAGSIVIFDRIQKEK